MRWISRSLGVGGRVGRGTFWLAQIIWGAAFVAFFAVGMWIAEMEMTATQNRLFYVVSISIIVTFAYATCVIAIRRFHDRDKSGWWIVPLMIVPSPPGDIIERVAGKPIGIIWTMVTGLVLTWTTVELGLLAGTAGPNRFGEATPPSKAWPDQ
jgi:uncharacterized membrane protein YhaH (DUF805 family)